MRFIKMRLVIAGAALGLFLFGQAALANTFGYVKADVLNVRGGPSTSDSIVGKLTRGTRVELISAEGDWFKISFKDGEAYVCAEYIDRTIPVTSRSEDETTRKGVEVVEYAKQFIGVPYRYGGNGPNAFDCSGFTKYVYAHFGVTLPRTARGQMSVGKQVSKSELQPGDLVIFRNGGHVGIYVGDNKYIHAPETGRRVSIDEMNRPLTTARRIF